MAARKARRDNTIEAPVGRGSPHAFTPGVGGMGQVELCEFGAGLIYIVSFWPEKVTQ